MKHGLSFASLGSYSVTTYLFPLTILAANLGIIGEMLWRRAVVRRARQTVS